MGREQGPRGGLRPSRSAPEAPPRSGASPRPMPLQHGALQRVRPKAARTRSAVRGDLEGHLRGVQLGRLQGTVPAHVGRHLHRGPPSGRGHAMRRPDGGQRGPRRRGGPDARPRYLLCLRKDRRRRLPRPQQRRRQLRRRGLPHGDRAPDRGRRASPDGRPPHLRRVSESNGPVDRCDEADLRDAARCAPTSLLRHPRRHPEGVASRRGTRRAGTRTAARGRLRPGGDLMSEEIVSELMRAHVYRLASAGQRVDGRRLDEHRKVSVARSFVKTAEGSARVKLGNTDVLVGIKMSVGEPYPDTPNTGVLSTSVELIPMASPTFEAGPPRPDAIELARVVDRGIRESKMVNMERLCITPKEKVWILFIDIHVLDYDGNLFDACSYAAVAALASTVAPAKSLGLGDDFPLPVEHWPVSVTTAKIKELF